MREKGQVLTLDMFLALSLIALLLGYSGLVMEQIRTRAQDEVSRYSLERVAEDAAETLIKTRGLPENWEDSPSSLQVLGLARVPNTLDLRKLVYLREICRSENWNPSKPEVQAVMRLFGGQNFEVRILLRSLLVRKNVADLRKNVSYTFETTLCGVKVCVELKNRDTTLQASVELESGRSVKKQTAQGRTFSMVVSLYPVTIEVVSDGKTVGVWSEEVIWDFWPGWNLGGRPEAENSMEVAVAKRSLVLPAGEIRNAMENLRHYAQPRGKEYTLTFLVRPGELGLFDWYLVLSPSSDQKPDTKMFVNRPAGANPDNFFPPKEKTIFPIWYHGHSRVEKPLTEADNGGNPNNYITLKVTGNPAEYVDVAVVAVPRCSPLELARKVWTPPSGILEVRVWR